MQVWWLKKMTKFITRITPIRVGIIALGCLNIYMVYTLNPELVIFNTFVAITVTLGMIYIIMKIILDRDPNKFW